MDQSPLQLARSALNDIAFGDDDTATGIVDEYCDGLDDLWSLRQANNTLRSAAWQLKEAVEAALIKVIGPQRAVRMDEMLLRVEHPTTIRCIDPEALAQYLELSGAARLVFRLQDLRVRALRAVASDRGEDPDAVVGRFFEVREGDGPPELVVCRMENAPWWALHLRHGQWAERPAKGAKPNTGGGNGTAAAAKH